MVYVVDSKKALAELDESLRRSAEQHRFGILNVLDLKQTLAGKGIDLPEQCRVYDVCNPQAASSALGHSMQASAILPCRISVFTEGGRTVLSTVRPTDLVRSAGFSGMEGMATEVERELVAIMDEAAA